VYSWVHQGMQSCALCSFILQTFTAQLSSPATLGIDGVVFECLLIESDDDDDREREYGCFNLLHLSHLFEI